MPWPKNNCGVSEISFGTRLRHLRVTRKSGTLWRLPHMLSKVEITYSLKQLSMVQISCFQLVGGLAGALSYRESLKERCVHAWFLHVGTVLRLWLEYFQSSSQWLCSWWKSLTNQFLLSFFLHLLLEENLQDKWFKYFSGWVPLLSPSQ